ncbi:Uncharacterised protein [Mycobacterium tuberculosis]|nr:Uncharacterised protein [Mycobacterium tuberculosis]
MFNSCRNVWRSRFCSPYTVSSVRSVGEPGGSLIPRAAKKSATPSGLPAKKRR